MVDDGSAHEKMKEGIVSLTAIAMSQPDPVSELTSTGKIMTSPLEAVRSNYHQVFVRDGYRCVYCGKDILKSLDSFAASHLDHLKPRRSGGTDDVINCVIACAVCNSMKAGFDPSPDAPVTEDTFNSVVLAARNYITDKRDGTTPCTYYRDYQYWLKESGRVTDDQNGN